MKYLIEAIKKSNAWIYLILYIIVNVSNIICSAALLKLISEYCNISGQAAMTILNKIIVVCMIQILLNVGGRSANRARDAIFTSLNNLYASKIAYSDTKLFNNVSPADIKTISGDIWSIATIPTFFIGIFSVLVKLLVNLVMIFTMVPFTIFCIITTCFIIMWFLSRLVDKKLTSIDKMVYENRRRRNAEIDEICNGFMDVRSASGKQDHHNKNIHHLNSMIFKIIGGKNIVSGAFSVIGSSLITIAMIVALLYVNDSNIIGASGVVLITYIFELETPLMELVNYLSEFSAIKVSAKNFDNIMQFKNEMEDGNINLSHFESGISFENVSFSYENTETVLNNISIYIPKGSKIGLCGKSGGGKSTILKLINRLYDPTAGTIKIDGIDIREIKRESLTNYIGMVPQEVHIFDGSVRDNLIYCCREKPSDTEILKFCKICNLDDIVNRNGLDGRVGPHGITLSGGQKQRFGIVRIMLSDPDIILLDEATSALDSDTEHDVMEYFIRSNKTVISVAHRLNTIRHCDTIYSIVDHNVVEKGSHKELMQNNGGYYQSQINKYYRY